MISEPAEIKKLAEPLKGLLEEFRYPLRALFLFSFFSNILILIVPIYTLQVLDRVINSGSMETLLYLTLITFITLFVWGTLQIIRAFIATRSGRWAREKLSPLILQIGYSEAGVRHAPQMVQLQNRLKEVEQFMTQSLNMLLDAPWAILFMIVIFLIHPLLGGIAVLGAAIMLALAIYNHQTTKHLFDSASQQFQQSLGVISFNERDAETAYVFGMGSSLVDRWKIVLNPSISANTRANERNLVVTQSAKTIRFTLQIIVMGLATYLALTNSITVGSIIAASILLSKALQPFDAAMGLWKSIISVKESMLTINQMLLDSPTERNYLPEMKLEGSLEVHDYYYIPPGRQEPVLENINFKLAAGSVLAVLGPSGAGKTTLGRALIGILLPASGSIRLGSADIFQLRRDLFGDKVGYLSQDPSFFDGTVAENIARMKSGYDPEKVLEAAEFAEIHEMILRLPEGYETPLMHYPLSSGQKQRIAIARAFFNQPTLVVLDEPNANMDLPGDISLNNMLEKAASAGITTIVISHRSNVIQKSSHILVLKNGKVADFGERDAIIRKIGRK